MYKSKVAARAILAFVVVLLPLEISIIIGLWPYLPLVGKAFAGMLITFCVCGAVYAVALTYQRITAPRLIVERDVVVMLARDGYRHLSAEHEAAKLALPAPVQVTEVIEKDDEVQRASVLVCYDTGMTIQKIAEATGVKPWKVQKWTSEYKANQDKRKAQSISNHS